MAPFLYLVFFAFLTNPHIQQRIRHQQSFEDTLYNCQSCQKTIANIQKEFHKPIFQREIISFLEFVCTEENFCLELTKQIVPAAIVEFIDVNPIKVCRDLYLC